MLLFLKSKAVLGTNRHNKAMCIASFMIWSEKWKPCTKRAGSVLDINYLVARSYAKKFQIRSCLGIENHATTFFSRTRSVMKKTTKLLLFPYFFLSYTKSWCFVVVIYHIWSPSVYDLQCTFSSFIFFPFILWLGRPEECSELLAKASLIGSFEFLFITFYYPPA